MFTNILSCVSNCGAEQFNFTMTDLVSGSGACGPGVSVLGISVSETDETSMIQTQLAAISFNDDLNVSKD